MPRTKGSTQAQTSLKFRDPEAFKTVSFDIEKLGISVIATKAKVSLTTVYSFLQGSRISPLAESKIQKGIAQAKKAQQKRTKNWV